MGLLLCCVIQMNLFEILTMFVSLCEAEVTKKLQCHTRYKKNVTGLRHFNSVLTFGRRQKHGHLEWTSGRGCSHEPGKRIIALCDITQGLFPELHYLAHIF